MAHSGEASIVGMILRNIDIAAKLIFWNLLALQKSLMHTVKSANDPWRTIEGKCSL